MNFNQRAEQYDEEMSEIRHVYRYLIKRIVQNTKPKDSVLDIGCGTGELTLEIARYATKVVGIDISEKMIEHARKKAENYRNVEFRQGSFAEISGKENFDAIVSNLAFHHVENKRLAIKNFSGLLKPDCSVVIGDLMYFFDPDQEKEKADAIREMLGNNPRFSLDAEDHFIERADNLAELFKQAGFCAETEQVFPILGIVCARR